MIEEIKHRNFYFDMLNEWLTDHHVIMTMENRMEIAAQERAFNHVWTTVGHAIPPMRRTLADLYFGL